MKGNLCKMTFESEESSDRKHVSPTIANNDAVRIPGMRQCFNGDSLPYFQVSCQNEAAACSDKEAVSGFQVIWPRLALDSEPTLTF